MQNKDKPPSFLERDSPLGATSAIHAKWTRRRGHPFVDGYDGCSRGVPLISSTACPRALFEYGQLRYSMANCAVSLLTGEAGRASTVGTASRGRARGVRSAYPIGAWSQVTSCEGTVASMQLWARPAVAHWPRTEVEAPTITIAVLAADDIYLDVVADVVVGMLVKA